MISSLPSARFKLTIIIPRPRLKGFYFNSMVQGRDTGGIFLHHHNHHHHHNKDNQIICNIFLLTSSVLFQTWTASSKSGVYLCIWYNLSVKIISISSLQSIDTFLSICRYSVNCNCFFLDWSKDWAVQELYQGDILFHNV